MPRELNQPAAAGPAHVLQQDLPADREPVQGLRHARHQLHALRAERHGRVAQDPPEPRPGLGGVLQ